MPTSKRLTSWEPPWRSLRRRGCRYGRYFGERGFFDRTARTAGGRGDSFGCCSFLSLFHFPETQAKVPSGPVCGLFARGTIIPIFGQWCYFQGSSGSHKPLSNSHLTELHAGHPACDFTATRNEYGHSKTIKRSS